MCFCVTGDGAQYNVVNGLESRQANRVEFKNCLVADSNAAVNALQVCPPTYIDVTLKTVYMLHFLVPQMMASLGAHCFLESGAGPQSAAEAMSAAR